jgi:hypothetical protein
MQVYPRRKSILIARLSICAPRFKRRTRTGRRNAVKHSKSVNVELLPPVGTIQGSSPEESLNRLVQEKVAEILADRDNFIFEPFFRSRQIAYELKRLQTMPERRKWNLFFERHGCLVCVTRERIHVANGMRARCYNRTHSTLKQIIAEQTTGPEALASSCALLPTSVEQSKTISGNSTLAASRTLPRTLVGNGARVPRGWKKTRERRSNRG